MSNVEADLLIIGAGAAGLSAAIYGARHGLKTIVLEEKVPGGLTATAPLIENYPGFVKIIGLDLMDKITEHAMEAGAEIIDLSKVVKIEKKDKLFVAFNDEGDSYSGKALILAMGSEYQKLGVPGEKELLGRGVSYCATCDGPFFKNKDVAVIGGGNSALDAVLQLINIASKIYLINNNEKLKADFEKWVRNIGT